MIFQPVATNKNLNYIDDHSKNKIEPIGLTVADRQTNAGKDEEGNKILNKIIGQCHPAVILHRSKYRLHLPFRIQPHNASGKENHGAQIGNDEEVAIL